MENAELVEEDYKCDTPVDAEILNSFEECYRPNINVIPNKLKPDSTHHGKRSYTKSLGMHASQEMHSYAAAVVKTAFLPMLHS